MVYLWTSIFINQIVNLVKYFRDICFSA